MAEGRQQAEVELRVRFPLGGGFLVPLACFLVILGDAVSVFLPADGLPEFAMDSELTVGRQRRF